MTCDDAEVVCKATTGEPDNTIETTSVAVTLPEITGCHGER